MVSKLDKNKTNSKKMEEMFNHIHGYLIKGSYSTLLLELCIQDGVIQIVKINEVDKKKSVKI
jgi:hypothetical protein